MSQQPQQKVLWNNLEDGIHHIMLNLEQGLSYEKYMELYTGIYNHCISQNPSNISSPTASSTAGKGTSYPTSNDYEINKFRRKFNGWLLV